MLNKYFCFIRLYKALAVAFSLIGFVCFSAFASENLIANPRFEGEEGWVPYDWLLYRGNVGEQLIVVEEDITGERVFLIDSRPSPGFSTLGFGIRSMPVLAEPGETYTASATVRTAEGGTAGFYIDFWDRNLKRVDHKATSSRATEWTELSLSMETPADAVLVSTILYAFTTSVGKAYYKDVSLVKQEFSD